MSYRFIELTFIVFLTSVFARPGFGQQDAGHNPFGNADPFSGGIEADGGISELPNNNPQILTKDEGQQIKMEINQMKALEKHLHTLIDRAVKDAQRSARVSEESVNPQLQAKIEQLADKLFAVEQSLTNANIRLKSHALATEVAEMKKRDREKETINNQRVKKWLSHPARESKLQAPASDEQPFGNGGDPFSGSL